MSSQFSYELDERQIRILMQDTELVYNEDMWYKFEELADAQAKSANSLGNYIPTINFGVSRSIIVPILFIILIGGLSAMLFSFVDFKKKESIEKEVPYIANAINTTKPVTVIKPIIKPKQAAIIKPDTSSIVKTTTVSVSNPTTVTLAPEIKKEEPIKVVEKPKEETVAVVEHKKENVIQPAKKKKKRKMKVEELPTINTSTSLNDGSGEPELELK